MAFVLERDLDMNKPVRPKIVALAQIIAQSDKEYTMKDPEYYGMECVVSDELADLLLHMEVRKKITSVELAKKANMPLDKTEKLLEEACVIGIVEYRKDSEGVKQYALPIFVPGSLEMMVMNIEQVEKYPQIAKAFERLSFLPLEHTAAIIPVGGAGTGMHVIPVEAAIPTETKIASYEEISHWLKKTKRYCVGSCSCRVTRRLLGEGCGHLEKDMCIGMGDFADYMIETGRCREVTYDEVLEILKRAEENGLVHQVTNLDGPDEVFGLCNCCRCSCFGLRASMYFNTPNTSRSNFVAKVDEEKCVACGQCVEYCPANAVKLGQKLETKTPIKEIHADLPDDMEWGEDKFNLNYRESMENVVPTGTSPCKAACPAHIAVQGYLRLASQGKYKEALQLIKKENPFPAVCGRICNHQCETECMRNSVDEAVAIDEVKRFIADHDLEASTRFIPPMINSTGKPYPEKIAIIGAGPAGMTCAYFLAEQGYKPTVFEKASRPGGMLVNGIPGFRLEKDIVEAEIDILKEMGVEFRCGVEIGKDVTISLLREEGYKGFYIAIGAQGGRKINVPGEEADGVQSGIRFIGDVCEGKSTELTGKTIVIGGGNVAVDVARTAVRIGSDSVDMYCLESKDIMPATADEVEEAVEEGVGVNCGWGPKEIIVENGKATGVVFKKCISVFDDEHRFAPKYDENDCITVACENVLISVGQSIVWGELLKDTKVELRANGTIIADELTYQTAEQDIFAGGDVYTGPKFAINAIAAGKEAAISLHRYVHEGQSLTIGRNRNVYKAIDKENVVTNGFDNSPRQIPGYNKAKARSFAEVKMDFTEEQIRKETARCLGCGASKVDQNVCLGCGVCTTKCKFDAIHLEKKFDGQNVPFEMMMETVMPYVAQRQKNIEERAKAEANKK